jgi:hypothetical protein
MSAKRNLMVLILSVIAGVLLIISGTRGPFGIYEAVVQSLPLVTGDPLILSIAGYVALIFISLASLGGFTVILGGFLVYKNHVKAGKLAMSIGAGVGILSLILIAFTIAVSRDWSIITSEHSPVGWTGLILAFVARTIAK